MKILLISGGSPLPGALRHVITHGSTSLLERQVSDGSVEVPSGDADRIVFWATADDRAVRELAQRYARATDERADRLVFVTDQEAAAPDGLAPNEAFVWPADEDRLKMAFMTSA